MHLIETAEKVSVITYFTLISIITHRFFLLLDILRPENTNNLYGFFFFLPLSIISLIKLLKKQSSATKNVKNKENLVIKNNYYFSEEKKFLMANHLILK